MKNNRVVKKIDLLNSEGPFLKAEKYQNGDYVLYDNRNVLVEKMDHFEFMDFIYNKKSITYTDGNRMYYMDFNFDTRASDSKLKDFIFDTNSDNPSDNIQKDSWLSPYPEEREWQIKSLKELFPSYPSLVPKWKYMDALIQIALKYKESIEEEDLDNRDSYDEENG